MFDLSFFIEQHVTKRSVSLFASDINANKEKLLSEIQGASILVIGGAGTIGSNFIKSILRFHPRSLIVVDINENGLTELTRDLRGDSSFEIPKDYVTYPMSYSDPVFEKMFRDRGGFDIVANFSAHKHVRSEKDKYSVEALLENNVIRARQLLQLLFEFRPRHFFCVSTDKAANPVNIMGGSKKIMEEMIMAYSANFPVTTARFANVAFSNGSLPAGFLDRISKKQPISGPSDVTRYFVSPEESGQICLLACILGNSGDIYFPKLRKEQVMKFSEIASKLLKELGYEVRQCKDEGEAFEFSEKLNKGSKLYPVLFSESDTTGEKQYEEFFTFEETVDMNRYHALGVVTNSKRRPVEEIDDIFNSLKMTFSNSQYSKSDIVEIMRKFLVNFQHEEKEKSLDSKM